MNSDGVARRKFKYRQGRGWLGWSTGEEATTASRRPFLAPGWRRARFLPSRVAGIPPESTAPIVLLDRCCHLFPCCDRPRNSFFKFINAAASRSQIRSIFSDNYVDSTYLIVLNQDFISKSKQDQKGMNREPLQGESILIRRFVFFSACQSFNSYLVYIG